MKDIRNNKNFRINKYGDVELCTGIEDVTGNLIYENDLLKFTRGEIVKIIYDHKKKRLVGIGRFAHTFSIQDIMTKYTLNNYYSILTDSEIYDVDYKQ